MPDENKPPVASPHFEDPYAPIVYADVCLGGGAAAGDNITLTFAAKILDHNHNPPSSNTKTVLRLVVPRQSAAATADLLKLILASMDAGGGPMAHSTIN
jgi:hypothetical protein